MFLKNLIDKHFGGVKELAGLLDHKHKTVVYYWCKNNAIPLWRIAEICEKAKQKGRDVSGFMKEYKVIEEDFNDLKLKIDKELQ